MENKAKSAECRDVYCLACDGIVRYGTDHMQVQTAHIQLSDTEYKLIQRVQKPDQSYGLSDNKSCVRSMHHGGFLYDYCMVDIIEAKKQSIYTCGDHTGFVY